MNKQSAVIHKSPFFLSFASTHAPVREYNMHTCIHSKTCFLYVCHYKYICIYHSPLCFAFHMCNTWLYEKILPNMLGREIEGRNLWDAQNSWEETKVFQSDESLASPFPCGWVTSRSRSWGCASSRARCSCLSQHLRPLGKDGWGRKYHKPHIWKYTWEHKQVVQTFCSSLLTNFFCVLMMTDLDAEFPAQDVKIWQARGRWWATTLKSFPTYNVLISSRIFKYIMSSAYYQLRMQAKQQDSSEQLQQSTSLWK